MQARAYHHGNLRPALVEAALERLERDGVEGLTLRALAAQVGVSHAAPYAHFRDKNALLAAVAAAGFRALGRALRAAGEASGAPAAERLARMGAAYVAFARARPALYALMFDRAAQAARSEELDEAADAAWAELNEAVAASVPAAQTRVAAVAAWSLVHGLASLLIGGRLRVAESEAALVESVTRLFAERLSAAGSADPAARTRA